MLWSSFSRNLCGGIENILIPAALRIYSKSGFRSSFGGITNNNQEVDCRFCKIIMPKEKGSRVVKKKDDERVKNFSQVCTKRDSTCTPPQHSSCAIAKFLFECCGNPCPNYEQRLDCSHYFPTDKAKRKYQQTWVNCPPPEIKPRRVCCYDSKDLPPFYRRTKLERSKTCTEFDTDKMKAFCFTNFKTKCPRVTTACCKSSRTSFRCTYNKLPSGCQKHCCPYPAYSECFAPRPVRKRNRECECHTLVSRCHAYLELQRKLLYKLPPTIPAWPPKRD